MIVITDATPLIEMAQIGHHWLLEYLFQTIIIPDGVYLEVAADGLELTGAAELRVADWLRRQRSTDRSKIDYLRADLDPGEPKVLVLAEELNADLVLLDETNARLAANMLGLRFIGTIGVLMLAKHLGKIEAVRPLLDDLRGKHFFISDMLYRMTLRAASEALA